MRQISPHPPLPSAPTAHAPAKQLIRSRRREPEGYELRPNFREILNQLIHFENSSLVVRACGLSCRRDTSFGPFTPVAPNQCRSHFVDRISGLTIDIDQIEAVFLIDWISSEPSLEFLFKEDGFAVSIQLGKSGYSDFIIAHLIENYATEKIPPSELWLAGAGAWMDEWQHVQSRGVLHRTTRHQFSALFEGAGFQFRITGEALTDFPNSTVHRISARDGRTYIFADDSIILDISQNKDQQTHGKN